MKPSIPQTHSNCLRFLHRLAKPWLLLCVGLAISRTQAADTLLQLGFSVSSFTESNRYVVLRWNAQAGKTYLVQSRTNLSADDQWVTIEPVKSATNGVRAWQSPYPVIFRSFYRLVLPQPQVDAIEPAFSDSSDPGSFIYVTGQSLPTNGFVVINGHSLPIIDFDPNGTWLKISLNGLPPGEPWFGISVRDNASNIVATLQVQSPMIYDTAMTTEQLEGPPDEPPASPLSKKEFKGHVTLLKAFDDDNDEGSAARHIKSGHVTLMKAYDDEEDSQRMARMSGGSAKEFKGHVTLLKREMSPGGPDVDGDGWPTSRMKAKEKANRTKCQSNLRINPPTGELLSEEVDLAIPGRGLDFAWVRTYRSRTGTNTAQGAGWDFSYNVRLSRQPDGTARLCTGNGRCETFYPDGTNGWFRDEYFAVVADLDRDGIPDIVTFSDTGRWVFRPQVQGDASSGKLTQIIDRNNNTVRCEYDTTSGRLLRVVDTLDRTNTIAYTQGGLVSSVTDFSGRIVRYEYDGNGDLTACVSPPVTGTPNGNDFPGGKTNRYTYSSGFADSRLNHNLLTCTDGKGQTWLQVTYQTNQSPVSLDFDAVASVVAGGDSTHLWRGRISPSPTNGYAFCRCIMNDPVGNVTECYYDSRHRCVKLQEFTGRANPAQAATPALNRPAGKLRPGDPDYFETQFEWNADSLCTVVRDPEGGSTESYYERSYNQNNARSNHAKAAFHGGDLRLLRFSAPAGVDADGDGIPDALVQTFEHDPRFGSGGHGGGGGGGWIIMPALNGVAINTKGTGADKGRVAGGGLEGLPIGNGVAIKTKGTGADKNRIAPGLPLGNGVAINTKGTGADKNRIAGVPPPNGVAIKTKGTGADANRTAGGGDNSPIIRGSALGGLDFVTRCTDTRGTETVVDYDNQGNATQFTWQVDTMPPTLSMSYNSQGQLTSVTNVPNASGYRRVDTLEYYTNGPQAGYCRTFIVDATGPVITVTSYEYDSRGNLTKATDALGRATKFHNNSLNQCVRIESPTNVVSTCATDYYYDANDNLTACVSEVRDETDALRDGHLVLIGHDFMDRVVTVAEQISASEFATNRFTYDGNGRVVQCDSPLAVSGQDPNNVVRYEYDERGLLFRRVAAPGTGLGATNEWGYDGNGNMRVAKIEAITIKQKVYDGFDRCVSISDAMGNVFTRSYDRVGNVVYERFDGEMTDVPGSAGNRRLSEIRYEYDKAGRPTRRHMSFFDVFTELPLTDGESTLSLTYAPNGACISATDDNGHVTRYSYDTQGRMSTITDPKTNVLSYTYDACGNVLSATQSDRSDLTPGLQQFTVSYTYDNLDRLARSVDNVGNTNRYAYDSRNNLVLHSGPRGNETACVYDGLSRCVSTTCYDGAASGGITISTSHTEHDVNSRCVSTTDSNTNTTSYLYDSLDRCVSVVEADKTGCSLIWSPRSNLILYGDARGTVISNSFDDLDRCVRRDITPGSGVASSTTFESFSYDGCSRCVAASNDVSGATFAYDSLGNCAASTLNGLTTTCSFDGMGNCVAMTYPSGRIVTRTYDGLDEVATVSSSAGGGLPPALLATYAYEGPGRIGRISRANNINTRLQWDGLTNPGNATGDFGWRQVSAINHQVAGGGAVVDQRTSKYDRGQNKILRMQTVPFFTGGPVASNLITYDALDRLTQFSRVSGSPNDLFRAYSLDGNGNRLFGISNGVAAPYTMDPTQPDPADFQMNQYTITPFAIGPQQYDADGNLVSRAIPGAQLVYTYDYADRLVSVADLSGGLPDQIAVYNYDALGRRISKLLHPGHPPLALVAYAYGGDRDDTDDPILEMRVNGALAQSFVLADPRSDDEMSLVCAFNSLGQPLYHHCDEMGNDLALTDASGNVVERYKYDDYGLPQFLSPDGLLLGTNGSPAGNPFLFHGMEWDPETQLYGVGMSKGMYNWIKASFDSRLGRSISGTVRDVHNLGSNPGTPWNARSKEDVYVWKIKSKEDVYVWKIKSKEDVYVWKTKSKEDVYVWKIKSKEDVYVWKVTDGKKASVVISTATILPGASYAKHTKTGHVTLMK